MTLPPRFGTFVACRMAPESPKQVPDGVAPSQDVTGQRSWGDRSPDEEDTIDLSRFVRASERRWKAVVVAAVLAGALGFVLASLRPLAYQGVTTLLVVPPSQPNGVQMNPATFRSIVENATLAKEVVEELKLQDRFTPQGFLERALGVEEVRGTNIVKVKVILADPNLAAEASRLLAQKAIVLTQQVNQQDGASIQGQLKNYLTDALQRFQTAEKALLAYKQSAQVDLVKEDTDAELKERGDLLRLTVDIAAEHARLAAAEREIKGHSPLLSAPRIPGAEEALRRTQPAAKSEVLPGTEETRRRTQPGAKGEVDSQHLDLTNPFVNPVYQTLDFQIATTRTRIAALEKERDHLTIVKKLGGKELTQLNELYRRQIEQARLQANFDLATKVYTDLAVRYEQSRTQPVGSTAQLQVVDGALPPDHPLSRKRLQYAAIGAVAGVVGTVLMVVLWENRSRRRHENPF